MSVATAATVIEVRKLTRTYHVGDVDVLALRGVDLTIRRGEFVAIMGSSGSGKSTLMSILGCLDKPTSGQYLFEGIDVAGLPEPALAGIRSEKLGFVFQSYNLLARTSAIENVELPLIYALTSTTGSERSERARESLRVVSLVDRERNGVVRLSDSGLSFLNMRSHNPLNRFGRISRSGCALSYPDNTTQSHLT